MNWIIKSIGDCLVPSGIGTSVWGLTILGEHSTLIPIGCCMALVGFIILLVNVASSKSNQTESKASGKA